VLIPLGGAYGSSNLKDNFSEHLKRRLLGARMFQNGVPFDGIVKRKVPHFEDHTKREIDITKHPNDYATPIERIHVLGLQEDAQKRFDANHVVMTK
jgi:hypothetical protein